MCCLFGLVDPNHVLTGQQKTKLLHQLATAAEARGTDASGVAYHIGEQLVIRKAPVAGHKLKFYIPDSTTVVMGHTRMATQGSARKNKNNHPFVGQLGLSRFALAHNGVLYNDMDLRRELCLPKPKVETDSYIAVQLLMKQEALNFSSLRFMAEKVEGSFTFTVLDEQDNLYIVKGDSPFYLLKFPAYGLYLYASTEQILHQALSNLHLSAKSAVVVKIQSGEIVRVDSSGELSRSTFDDRKLYCWYSPHTFRYSPFVRKKDKTYVDELKSVAGAFGYTPESIDRFISMGYMPEEIEEYLYCQEI